VGGSLAFTTSPANCVLDVRLADGQFVAACLSRVGHAPHRAWMSLEAVLVVRGGARLRGGAYGPGSRRTRRRRPLMGSRLSLTPIARSPFGGIASAATRRCRGLSSVHLFADP
jgi:hypothetical protein